MVWSNVGSFTKRTSAGDDSVTGLTGTPKFLMLWTSHALTNRTVRASWRHSAGFASGTTAQMGMTTFSADNSASSAAARRQDNTAILIRCDAAGAEVTRGVLASFDANGFTITWSGSIQDASIIHYMVLGGDDFSAKVVAYLLPDLGAGTTSVSGAGFTPTGALALSANLTTAISGAADATISFGAIGTDGAQFAIANVSENGRASSDTARLADDTQFVSLITPTNTASQQFELDWNAWESDGMNITINEFTAGTADDYVYLAFFSGVKVHVGNFTKNATAAPFSQDIVTGLPYTPVATILASNGQASPTMGAIGAHSSLQLGASDGTNHAAIQVIDWDNLATTQADTWPATDRAFIQISSNTDDNLDTLGTVAHSAGSSAITFDASDTGLLSTIFYVTIGPDTETHLAAAAHSLTLALAALPNKQSRATAAHTLALTTAAAASSQKAGATAQSLALTLAAAGIVHKQAAALLPGTLTVVAVATSGPAGATHEGTAALSLALAVAAAGIVEKRSAAALPASLTVAPAGSQAHAALAQLTTSLVVAAAGSKTQQAEAVMAAELVATAEVIMVRAADAALALAITLAATGSVPRTWSDAEIPPAGLASYATVPAGLAEWVDD